MRQLIIDLTDNQAVKVIQRGLGVEADGLWGPITRRAWEAHSGQLPAPELFDVPLDWLPMARMRRVIVHWTGGHHHASRLDCAHYHLLVETDGRLVRGDHSIVVNEVIGGKSSSEYAAHTARCNTGSIGLGLCGMAGATRRPLNLGRCPLTPKQWARACEVLAVLCDRYAIPVNRETVLTHAEVEDTLGIPQPGKWDITVLEFATVNGARPIGDMMREQVLADLARLKRA